MPTATTFLDNPLLKVSRPVAACSRCRTAKIKCDGKLPACSACEKVGKASTCSGASDEFAKGKERSYVASLEGYCERLERNIAELHDRRTSLSAEGNGVARQMSITAVSSAGQPGSAHHREVSDIDDLVGDFGFLLVTIPCLFHMILTRFPGRSTRPRATSTASLRAPPSPTSSSQSPQCNRCHIIRPIFCLRGMRPHRCCSTTLTTSLCNCRSLSRRVFGPRWTQSINLRAASPSHSTTGYYAWFLPSPRRRYRTDTVIRVTRERWLS